METTGIEQITIERTRQITSEGYNATHDGQHKRGELAAAAGTYALAASAWGFHCYVYQQSGLDTTPTTWPFSDEDWKPTHDNKIKMLSKAGALIAAEIDRLLAED